MKKEYITEGTEFQTVDGWVNVTSVRDYDSAWCTEYTTDYEEDEDGEIDFSREITRENETILTRSDIARRMRDYDGHDHKVYLEKSKKYWLDCDSNGDTQFALYENKGYDTCVLNFDFDDIPGLEELEKAGKIGEAYALIDAYIEQELGFLPDYEVG